MSKGSGGVTRGDRRKNARRERLRGLLPRDGAVLSGIIRRPSLRRAGWLWQRAGHRRPVATTTAGPSQETSRSAAGLLIRHACASRGMRRARSPPPGSQPAPPTACCWRSRAWTANSVHLAPLGPDAGPSRGPKAPWVTAAPSFPHVTRRLAAVLLEQLPDHDTEQTGRCCRRRGLRFGGWLSHDYAWLTARPTGPHAALVCPVGRGSVHGG